MSSPNLKKKIIIYTDGACKGNPGKGGWGAVIFDNDIKKEISGNCNNTTNNIMEMTAAIKALSCFKTKKDIVLYTDSNYLKLGITEWIKNWKKNNWVNKKREAIKNKELWLTLDKLNKLHLVEWKWVKAHNGDPGNERADYLASTAAIEL
ncbi:ribonuclease HI [Alphaproteobacteria bacterium]|nr:ribonuclease HI [Alphaproteobacteria bacterium]